MENYKWMNTDGRLIAGMSLWLVYFGISGQSLQSHKLLELFKNHGYTAADGVIKNILRQNITHSRWEIKYDVRKVLTNDVVYLRSELSDMFLASHSRIQGSKITAILMHDNLEGFILNEFLHYE